VYQAAALRRLEHALSIEERDDDVHLSRYLKGSADSVLNMFRDFNNIPGPLTSKWLEFVSAFAQPWSVYGARKLYVQLAKRGASLEKLRGL